MTADPYEVLGVSRDASHEEIKAAYLVAVQLNHPDRLEKFPEAVRLLGEEKLKQVNAAYAEIREIEKRERAEREQAQRQRSTRERAERERAEREQAERERAEREQAQRQRSTRERAERERAERERAERERAEREQAEREQAEREQAQRQRSTRERAERERVDRRRRRTVTLVASALLLVAIVTGAEIFNHREVSSTRSSISVTNVTLQLVRTFSDPRGFSSVAFSPNGKILAVGETDDPGIYLWNTANGKLAAALTANQNETAWPSDWNVNALAFSPDGKTLAVGTGDTSSGSTTSGSTYLLAAATGHRTATLTDPHSQGVEEIAYSPNGKTIAIADGNGNIYLWNATSEQITATLNTGGQTGITFNPGGAFSPDGKTLVAVGYSGTMLWDIATGRKTATLTSLNPGDCPSAAYSPNGKTIAGALAPAASAYGTQSPNR